MAPIWLIVIACGVAAQLLKLAAYSAVNRRFVPAVAAQSHGLPSLQSTLLACLSVLIIEREGWWSPEAGFALVFAVVAIHDILKLRTAARAQREVVHRLVTAQPGAEPWRRQVAGYLDPLNHHPAHVALGVAFGVLFALASGQAAG